MHSFRGTSRFISSGRSGRRGRGTGRTSSPGRRVTSAFRASPLSLSMHPLEPNPPSASQQPETEPSELPLDQEIASINASPLSPISTSGASNSGSAPVPVTLQKVYDDIKNVNGRLRMIDDRTVKMSAVLKELQEMLKKHCKSTFTIKGSVYEAELKSKLAKLFCHSLTRKPEDSEIQACITSVLGRDAREKYKFDMAFTFAKNKLTEMRTEERRKVVGVGSYCNRPYIKTSSLRDYIMSSMQTEDGTDCTKYLQHLAILRKFVREVSPFPSNNFYEVYREWLNEHYSSLNDTIWSTIISEDAAFDYDNIGNGFSDEVTDYEEEITIESNNQQEQ